MDPLRPIQNAAGAIRVSSDKQTQEGDSPEDQREQILVYAKSHNLRIIKWFVYSESATKDHQPMQQAIDYCTSFDHPVEALVIKSIDRLTRGGSGIYSSLKVQLDRANVSLQDIYGVIDRRRINTLEHTGFKYRWSEYTPSHKAEILEAERSKDEFRDIMTRMIGAEIRYTQLGYWQRQPGYGYVSERIDTINGRRMILQPHSTEAYFVRRLFELRAEGKLSDLAILEQLNDEGMTSRKRRKRVRMGSETTTVYQGGQPMRYSSMLKIVSNPLYAGIICEKWTNGKPIKAVFSGLVTTEEFNKANRGLKTILEHPDGRIEILKTKTKRSLAIVNRKDEFPFRHYVLCPNCDKPFLGSSSRGKAGKLYPAYHCSKNGHYLRIPKAKFEETIEAFIQSLQVEAETVDRVMELVRSVREKQSVEIANTAERLEVRIQTLRLEAQQTVAKLKQISSDIALKYLEDDLMRIEEEIKKLTIQKVRAETEIPVNDEEVLTAVKKLVEHPYEYYEKQIEPAKKAQFFALFFNKRPSYQELSGGTQKTPLITGVNSAVEYICNQKTLMVTSRRIELRLPG